jgi:hypothetical protein
MRHAHPARVRYKIALTISRFACSGGLPPGAAGTVSGKSGSMIAHWRSVRSLGYLRFDGTQNIAARAGTDREHRAMPNAQVTRIFGKYPGVPANETLILAYICASRVVIKHVLSTATASADGAIQASSPRANNSILIVEISSNARRTETEIAAPACTASAAPAGT